MAYYYSTNLSRDRTEPTDVINKNILQNIRNQEMDRKDFLKYSGVVLVGLLGLKGVAMLFEPLAKPQTIVETQQTTATKGFGSGKYGA